MQKKKKRRKKKQKQKQKKTKKKKKGKKWWSFTKSLPLVYKQEETSKAQPMLLIHDVSIFQLWFWAWPICIWRGYHGTGLMSTPKSSNYVWPSSRFVIKYWSLCWCKCLYFYTKHSTSLGSFDPIFSTGLYSKSSSPKSKVGLNVVTVELKFEARFTS